jgi:hypothetical protein
MKTSKLAQPSLPPRASQIQMMMSRHEFSLESTKRRLSSKRLALPHTKRTLKTMPGLLECEITSVAKFVVTLLSYGSTSPSMAKECARSMRELMKDMLGFLSSAM